MIHVISRVPILAESVDQKKLHEVEGPYLEVESDPKFEETFSRRPQPVLTSEECASPKILLRLPAGGGSLFLVNARDLMTAVENAIRTGHHHIEFEDDGGFSGDYQED